MMFRAFLAFCTAASAGSLRKSVWSTPELFMFVKGKRMRVDRMQRAPQTKSAQCEHVRYVWCVGWCGDRRERRYIRMSRKHPVVPARCAPANCNTKENQHLTVDHDDPMPWICIYSGTATGERKRTQCTSTDCPFSRAVCTNLKRGSTNAGMFNPMMSGCRKKRHRESTSWK